MITGPRNSGKLTGFGTRCAGRGAGRIFAVTLLGGRWKSQEGVVQYT